MSTFLVGEIAIVRVSDREEIPVGSEITILEVPESRHFACRFFGEQAYKFGEWYIRESALRKKYQPQDWRSLCKLDSVPTVQEETA